MAGHCATAVYCTVPSYLCVSSDQVPINYHMISYRTFKVATHSSGVEVRAVPNDKHIDAVGGTHILNQQGHLFHPYPTSRCIFFLTQLCGHGSHLQDTPKATQSVFAYSRTPNNSRGSETSYTLSSCRSFLFHPGDGWVGLSRDQDLPRKGKHQQHRDAFCTR